MGDTLPLTFPCELIKMSELSLLAIACSLVAAMFGLLCCLLGWIGSQAISEIKLLNSAILGIDKRLTIVETTCEIQHANNGSNEAHI